MNQTKELPVRTQIQTSHHWQSSCKNNLILPLKHHFHLIFSSLSEYGNYIFKTLRDMGFHPTGWEGWPGSPLPLAYAGRRAPGRAGVSEELLAFLSRSPSSTPPTTHKVLGTRIPMRECFVCVCAHVYVCTWVCLWSVTGAKGVSCPLHLLWLPSCIKEIESSINNKFQTMNQRRHEQKSTMKQWETGSNLKEPHMGPGQTQLWGALPWPGTAAGYAEPKGGGWETCE